MEKIIENEIFEDVKLVKRFEQVADSPKFRQDLEARKKENAYFIKRVLKAVKGLKGWDKWNKYYQEVKRVIGDDSQRRYLCVLTSFFYHELEDAISNGEYGESFVGIIDEMSYGRYADLDLNKLLDYIEIAIDEKDMQKTSNGVFTLYQICFEKRNEA